MFTDKVKNHANISIVVLDGTHVLREKNGVEPLRYALNQAMKPDDQVVVLVIFNTSDMVYSPVVTSCCIGMDCRNHHHPSEKERYVRILREEISQGTEDYMKVFRPFYKECKSKRVKFMVKIVVGSTLDAIVNEEKSNIGATSVVIGRNFAKEYAPWVTRKNNKPLSYIDDVKVLTYTFRPQGDVAAGSSSVQKEVYMTQSISRFKRKTLSHDEKLIYTLPNFEGIYQPSTSSSSIETNHESSQEFEGVEIVEETTTTVTPSSSKNELGFLAELSWEVISEMTERFMNIIPVDSNEAFQMYRGFLQDQRRAAVFVKRYVGIEYRYVLEAEKKAASTMYHKNILGLLAFHKNEAALALVFPDASSGAFMDRFLNGFWIRELKISFQVKMNIAIGIAKGLRYMHEQCPRGAVIHGDLRPCNILLGNTLEPQITGFGQAKWLQFDQSSPTRNSCGHKHPSDLNSLNLIKSDILAFGILLLRLFCNRSAPRDDKSFVRWARPLLAQRAYHILYDELEYDVHGLLVVTSVAARCFSTRSKSRPCMSKVLSYLKGEVSCAEQTFPSTESSPNIVSTPDSSLWEL